MREQFLAASPDARIVLLEVDEAERAMRMTTREQRGHLLTTAVRERLERLACRAYEPLRASHHAVDAARPVEHVVAEVVALCERESGT